MSFGTSCPLCAWPQYTQNLAVINFVGTCSPQYTQNRFVTGAVNWAHVEPSSSTVASFESRFLVTLGFGIFFGITHKLPKLSNPGGGATSIFGDSSLALWQLQSLQDLGELE